MALDFGNKVENGGIPPQGVLSASEFNELVAQVNQNEEDIAAIDESNSIESITVEESTASGGYSEVTITETNGTETTLHVKNGEDGVDLGQVAVADNLITNDGTKVLSARQGYLIKGMIDPLTLPIIYTKDDMAQNCSFNTSGATVGSTLSSLNTSRHESWRCLLLEVKKGDSVYVKTQGGNNVRAYVVVDTELKVLSLTSGTSVIEENLSIVSDGYVIINCWYESYDIFCVKKSFSVNSDEEGISNLLMYERIDPSALIDNCYYDLFGSTVSDTTVENANWACLKTPVKKGQTVEVYSSADTSSTGRIYALTDSSRIIYNVSGGGTGLFNNSCKIGC